jgi:predicted transcriptional regulator
MYCMAKSTITVRVEDDTRSQLDALAEALDRDRSYVVNQALDAYLDTYRWQVDHIKQGIREADAGKFVDEREVRKVIGRLRRK